MSLYPLRYAGFGGYVFRVEQMQNGRWAAIGRQAGRPAYQLTKVGDASEADAMQGKLDAWAKANRYKPTNWPKPAEQPSLFGAQ